MDSHHRQVDHQFGAVAQAYLTSAAHARGEDLTHIAQRLQQARSARGPLRALDVGCGAGHVSFAMAPHATSVVAVDLSPRMLDVVARTARERNLHQIATQVGTAEHLPFPDAHFDVVATRFSAHHWADLVRGVHEMRRVLRPDGLLVVVDVVAPASALCDSHLQAVELLRDASHVRDYSVAEWHRALAQAGLAVTAERTWPLRLDFTDWVARMRTPAPRVQAIRGLLDGAPAEVRERLSVEADGSFSLEVAMFEAGSVGRSAG